MPRAGARTCTVYRVSVCACARVCVLRRYSQQLCLLEHMQNEITSLRGVSQLAQEKLFVLNREFASLRRQHAVVQQDFAAYRTPPGRPLPPLPPFTLAVVCCTRGVHREYH